jgi:hypothetical protein
MQRKGQRASRARAAPKLLVMKRLPPPNDLKALDLFPAPSSFWQGPWLVVLV